MGSTGLQRSFAFRNPVACIWGMIFLTITGCGDSVVNPPVDLNDDPYTIRFVTPEKIRTGENVPIVIEALDDTGTLDTDRNDTLHIAPSSGLSGTGRVIIKHGRGSLAGSFHQAGEFTLTVEDVEGERTIVVMDSIPGMRHETLPAENVWTWTSGVDHYLLQDLVIPEGITLSIEKGSRVLLGDRVNLIVRGHLVVNGTEAQPVLFAPIDVDAAWGGITLYSTDNRLTYTFITGGGDDHTRDMGHSHSQPLVYVEDGAVELSRCFIIDNPGKALGAYRSRLDFSDGLISRNDTGGEMAFSLVQITDSHVLDIPNDDGVFVDDDNDGMYFWNVHASGEPSKIERSFFITGKDDAIDHNEAALEIKHSWLEGFLHEGVAGSQAHYVRIFDTVITGNEQGVEAGYGSPSVFVDHSVIINNDVGIRFGDSYDSGCSGKMEITNSIISGNTDNVRNYDMKTQGPVPDAITIRTSIVVDPDVDRCEGCVAGTPVFDAHYRLAPESIGKASADNGTDPGLLPR